MINKYKCLWLLSSQCNSFRTSAHHMVWIHYIKRVQGTRVLFYYSHVPKGTWEPTAKLKTVIILSSKNCNGFKNILFSLNSRGIYNHYVHQWYINGISRLLICNNLMFYRYGTENHLKSGQPDHPGKNLSNKRSEGGRINMTQ